MVKYTKHSPSYYNTRAQVTLIYLLKLQNVESVPSYLHSMGHPPNFFTAAKGVRRTVSDHKEVICTKIHKASHTAFRFMTFFLATTPRVKGGPDSLFEQTADKCDVGYSIIWQIDDDYDYDKSKWCFININKIVRMQCSNSQAKHAYTKCSAGSICGLCIGVRVKTYAQSN